MKNNINKIYIQPIITKKDDQSPLEYLFYGISSEKLPTDLLTNNRYHHTHNKKHPSLLSAATQKISITIAATFNLIAIVFILVAGLYFALPLTSLWIIIPIVLLSIAFIVLFSLLILGPITTKKYCQFKNQVTQHLFRNANNLLPFESIYLVEKEQEEYKFFENDQWRVAKNNLTLLPDKTELSQKDTDFFEMHQKKRIQELHEEEAAELKSNNNFLGRAGMLLKKIVTIEKAMLSNYTLAILPNYSRLSALLMKKNSCPLL